MKKTFALSLCIALCGLSSFGILQAQQSSSEFGIKAGLNVGNIVDNLNPPPEHFEFAHTTFFHAGIFWNHYFNQHWGTGIELLYNQKGGQNKLGLGTPVYSNYKLRFDYLSLPLIAKYRLQNLVLEAGAEMAYKFNLNVKSDLEVNEAFVDAIWDQDFEVGLLVGLAYHIKKLQIGIRYNYGLSYLSNVAYTDANGEPIGEKLTHNNRVLLFSVGYALIAK